MAGHPFPWRSRELDKRIADLHRLTPYGVSLSQSEIATAIGAHRSTIRNIERNALRKLRRLLRHDL